MKESISRATCMLYGCVGEEYQSWRKKLVHELSYMKHPHFVSAMLMLIVLLVLSGQ